MLGDLGGEFDLRRSANQFVGRRLKESRINSRFLLGSYHERTLRVLLPSEILELKKRIRRIHFFNSGDLGGSRTRVVGMKTRCTNRYTTRPVHEIY